MPKKTLFLLCLGLATLPVAGCKKTPPPLTEVEGRVLLNGNPLPNAYVEFMPELKGWGAEVNSTGLTDDKGYFRLTWAYREQPGAVVATHRVVVTDPPPTKEMRGPSQASQERLAAFLTSLKNRPIPKQYGGYSETPLRVEVKPDQKVYDLVLTR
jgi:hypothetical protein